MPRGKARPGIMAARAAARKIVGPTAANTATASLVMAIYSHTEAEREAATGYLRGQEQFADGRTKDGPVWLGHALWSAFMAGVDHERKEEADAEDDGLPATAVLGR